ncbi:MAG: hypothetical protein U1E89_12610 [Burkholderiaceae bacterium]
MPVQHASTLPQFVARRLAAAVSLAMLLLPALEAQAAPDAAAADETAHCIAAMQTQADDLARQVKAGDSSKQGALRVELVRASALVGRTYQAGLHDGKEAKARLKAAQAQQTEWDEPRRSRLRQSCQQRADAELASATRAERFIVERVADATMQRMLGAH